jgi:hypothetical protein
MRLVKRPTLLLALCGALGLAACGGGGDDDDDDTDDSNTDDNNTDDDDGNTDDDGGVNPDGEDNTYVIDAVNVPGDATEAGNLALDIDGDGRKDNALGGLLGLLSAAGLDIKATVAEQVATGGIILLANLKATDLTTATGVGLYVYLGDNPNPAPCESEADTECGKHLAGDGTFDISADSPLDAVVVGENAGGKFTGGPGEVTIELSLSDLANPLQIRLIGAKAEATVADGSLSAGLLGGAITDADIDNELLPAVHEVITSIMEEDGCAPAPDCCPAQSTGETILDFLDSEPADCVITLEELQTDPIISATLGNPDLDLEGDDGVKDAISLGIGFSAVTGGFTPPAP